MYAENLVLVRVQEEDVGSNTKNIPNPFNFTAVTTFTFKETNFNMTTKKIPITFPKKKIHSNFIISKPTDFTISNLKPITLTMIQTTTITINDIANNDIAKTQNIDFDFSTTNNSENYLGATYA